MTTEELLKTKQALTYADYIEAVKYHLAAVLNGKSDRETLLRVTETATKFDNAFRFEEVAL